MAETSIYQVFKVHEKNLCDSLKELSLPADADKVQKVVETFLTSLFENDGDYRQSLTQSEDYILQAALQLLQAQQNISRELAASLKGNVAPKVDTATINTSKDNGYTTILGAGIGAIAGGFLGSWAAVCGAIAGTAIVIYCSNKPSQTTKNAGVVQSPRTIQSASIDTNVFNTIIGKICQNIDNLIDTYRVQVKRIQNIYSQTEKPSLLAECQALFNQIANVHNVVEADKANVPTKVVNAVNLLEESLGNYGLTMKEGKVVYE